jgi:hypothetical protein
MTVAEPDLVLDHQITLTNLAAGQTYRYEIASRDLSGNAVIISSSLARRAAGDLEFTTELLPDTTPPILSGRQIVYRSSDRAVVSWVTSETGDSRVRYYPALEGIFHYQNEVTETADHCVVLTGLPPSSSTSWAATSRDQNGNMGDYVFGPSITTTGSPDAAPPGFNVWPSVRQDTLTDRAGVSWQTTEITHSYVLYGTSPATLDRVAPQLGYSREHEFTLTNLTDGMTVYYQVHSIDPSGNRLVDEIRSFTSGEVVDVPDWHLY